MPLLEVQPFVPPVAVNQNVLTREDETMLDFTMHRLAERVSHSTLTSIGHHVTSLSIGESKKHTNNTIV